MRWIERVKKFFNETLTEKARPISRDERKAVISKLKKLLAEGPHLTVNGVFNKREE